MTPQFYWTKVARAAFGALGRRGKASLPDLLADLGVQGKSAQSSMVQALARWARRGLVAIDPHAPHRAPRYSLTPAGRDLWNDAVRAAQARASAFFLVPASMPTVTPLITPATKVAPAPLHASKDRLGEIITCPACSERYPVKVLQEMRTQHGRVTCAGCQGDLARELQRAEAFRDDSE